MPRIAYLGPEGTFTEAALLRITENGMVPGSGPSDEFTPVPEDSTSAALAAVRSGDVHYACVPIENSIEGSVLPTLDSLATGSPLQVFAELTLDVAFSIVVRSGTAAADVGTVAAFPVASAQVRNWLAANLPERRAGAGQLQRRGGQRCRRRPRRRRREHRAGGAAVRPDRTGSDVVDEPNARTRFVLVGPPARRRPSTGADRTSVVLRLDNVPGALVVGDDRVRRSATST